MNLPCVNSILIDRYLQEQQDADAEQERAEQKAHEDAELLLDGEEVYISGSNYTFEDVELDAIENNDDWNEQLRLLANGEENKVAEYLKDSAVKIMENAHNV